ncbi:MAG: metal ABC transporter permease [Armatimonadota bacterium]|nr:metal ABC transporter permease [Armatimonadota bacterium]MDR7449525.1 metal ABC transporter permease [Armatimonadota bacterium]MDR7460545.1 metal ABC transporter permease [Armatimonadota bacterium]MDR7479707.1 metal ABC transporter permease [Armatimonadota bacterium]MDR7489108.1 metal ABC transporter permease [Armatimonadota bacterium]
MSVLQELATALGYAFVRQALLAAVVVGTVCAVMGSFLLVRRWALLGDAISHAVLPGVALAFLLGWPYVVGALVTGLLTALGIGVVERHTRLKQDAAMGLLFITAFALGLAIISRIRSPVDLFHVLFGNVLAVSRGDLVLTAVSGAVVVGTIALLYKELLLWAFDPVMAESVGLPVRRLHYLMLLLTSLTIVAALQAVGIVLVVAMLIAPPATAAMFSDRLHRLILGAVLVGVLTAVTGFWLAYVLDIASGATMVLVGAGLFAVAALFAPRRGVVVRALRRRRAAAQARLDDYLKALFAEDARATSVAVLAARVRDSAEGAIAVVRQLARLGLVTETPEGVRLTPAGRRAAAQRVRTHRLWERFLVDRAGMPWDQVHQAADRLEHVAPRRLTEELARTVGPQATDPHGAPIPTAEGEVARPAEEHLLSELQPEQAGTVTRVEDEDPEVLRLLEATGLVPGRRVRLVRAEPDGVRVAVGDGEIAIPRRVARSVYVMPGR